MKKLVGIMSMQRVCNYGSFLQAYGLKKMLESLGVEVTFVDYKPGMPVEEFLDKKIYYKDIIRAKVLRMASECVSFLPFIRKDIRYSLIFQKNYREYLKILNVKKRRKYQTEVDTLIIGSDEVFNCLQTNPEVGFSEELFGKNHKSKKLIFYAASFGNSTFEGIEKAGKKEILSNLLSEFNIISVRDANSGEVVKKLTDTPLVYNLDPVLMYDFSADIKDACLDKDYIVIYAYANRLTTDEIDEIIKFSKKENKKLISIGGYQEFCDEYKICAPFEVLDYIRKADYVITDTFHGTIFSIIGHRKFATFIRNGHGKTYGNYEKLMDLLERVGLSKRAVFKPDDLQDILTGEIDYDKVDDILQNHRKAAREYLKNNI